MTDFTNDERRRIQTSLRRRLRRLDPRNFVDVGFGIGLKDGRPDANRVDCVCVFVRRKRSRPRGQSRIPRQVTVRWRRGAAMPHTTLPTDVIELPSVSPVSFPITFDRHQFVAGAEILWRLQRSTQRHAGWLTVGHPFAATARRRRRAVEFEGLRLLARSRRRSSFDAAIVEATSASRSPAGLASRNEAWPVVGLPDIPALTGSHGESWLPAQPKPIQFQAYFPRFVIPQVGQLVNVVSAIASRATFAPGSSGAVWMTAGNVAAMQVAAAAPEFALGFGQALTSTLVWAEKALERQAVGRTVAGPIKIVSI